MVAFVDSLEANFINGNLLDVVSAIQRQGPLTAARAAILLAERLDSHGRGVLTRLLQRHSPGSDLPVT